MTKISIYNTKQFKKHGGLKKNAKSEYQVIGEPLNIPQVADYLKAQGYCGFETPYIFTHIKAVNKNGQAVKIFQDFQLNGGWLMTSPQELLTYLA